MQGEYFVAWKQNFRIIKLSFEIPIVWPQAIFARIVYNIFLFLSSLHQPRPGIFLCCVHAHVLPARNTTHPTPLECHFFYHFFKPYPSFKYFFHVCDWPPLWSFHWSSSYSCDFCNLWAFSLHYLDPILIFITQCPWYLFLSNNC